MTEPALIRRALNAEVQSRALEAGLPPLLARILAGRLAEVSPEQLRRIVSPRVAYLDHPETLPDFHRAVQRVALAVERGEHIALETDHDVDGVASHAVIHQALVYYCGHPPERLSSHIGHRIKEGYGLSEAVASRIIDSGATLVITADNGSSDEEQIARLKSCGIDVVVTDHHVLPVEGPPPSAYACVSPAREDSQFPDPAIAGCFVAWLLMCGVRRRLIEKGVIPQEMPTLAGLLDFVALGTVADCVSLGASINNRAVVTYGLKLINAMARPCWRVLRSRIQSPEVTAADLAFTIGPRINARGRLDEAMAGVRFLIAQDDEEAARWEAELHRANEERKLIERSLTSDAKDEAARQIAQGAYALTIYLPNGHAGVHGIVASRLVEAYGRPVVCFSPQHGDPGSLTGSARGIDGFHVRDALQAVRDQHPEGVLKFGGHAGAGGVRIAKSSLDRFRDLFDASAREQLGEVELRPVIATDGELAPEDVNPLTVQLLSQLEPYGRGFEAPVFEGRYTVLRVRPISDGQHLKLWLDVGGEPREAIWFGACEPGEQPSVQVGDRIRLAYYLEMNHWNGRSMLQLRVVHAAPE